jgi:hypothetical protein
LNSKINLLTAFCFRISAGAVPCQLIGFEPPVLWWSVSHLDLISLNSPPITYLLFIFPSSKFVVPFPFHAVRFNSQPSPLSIASLIKKGGAWREEIWKLAGSNT